jgi:type II secretory pathway pseudopilin PulG
LEDFEVLIVNSSSSGEVRQRDVDERGFVLGELLVVMAIITVIVLVASSFLGGIVSKSSATNCRIDANAVENAVQAYDTETGGSPVVTAEALVDGQEKYLTAFPTSPFYKISIVRGVVEVASPSSASPVSYGSANMCNDAGVTEVSTTVTDAAASKSASSAVQVTPSSSSDNGYDGAESLRFSSRWSITSFTAVIQVVRTAGISYQSMFNNLASGAIRQSHADVGGVVTYRFELQKGSFVPPSSSASEVGASYGDTGPVHSPSGDTWRVTSESNGIVCTIAGHF